MKGGMNMSDGDNPPRKRITLSERDWLAFTEALEEDREPSEAVKKAAARYNEWKAEARATVDVQAVDMDAAR